MRAIPWRAAKYGRGRPRGAPFQRIVPRYYYIFELHRPELRQRAAEYLTRTETKSGIYRALKQRGDRSKVVRKRSLGRSWVRVQVG